MSAEARKEMERTKELQHVTEDIRLIREFFGVRYSSTDVIYKEELDKQGMDYEVTLRGGFVVPGRGVERYAQKLYVDSKYRWEDLSVFWKQHTTTTTLESYPGEPQLTLP